MIVVMLDPPLPGHHHHHDALASPLSDNSVEHRMAVVWASVVAGAFAVVAVASNDDCRTEHDGWTRRTVVVALVPLAGSSYSPSDYSHHCFHWANIRAWTSCAGGRTVLDTDGIARTPSSWSVHCRRRTLVARGADDVLASWMSMMMGADVADFRCYCYLHWIVAVFVGGSMRISIAAAAAAAAAVTRMRTMMVAVHCGRNQRKRNPASRSPCHLDRN